MALETVIPTTVNEEEDVHAQFDIGLGSEIGKSGEEGSSVASEVFDENTRLIEKHELPSLLDLKMNRRKLGHDRDRCATFSTSRTTSKYPHLTSMTAHPPANDNTSMPEPTLILNETPETSPVSLKELRRKLTQLITRRPSLLLLSIKCSDCRRNANWTLSINPRDLLARTVDIIDGIGRRPV